jgi:ubiquinone/menaquinone biosynthesis C-methylase UbiE
MDKGSDFNQRFKAAIERNFDQSADAYDAFESKHHLFEEVTRRLCDLAGGSSFERVLDVGCGTGISTLSLYRQLKGSPRINGLDLSESMLARASDRCSGLSRVAFTKGDAEKLLDHYSQPFDAIFYTASLFLIPDYAGSLSQALKLLKKDGALFISFYMGFFDAEHRDAMRLAFPDMNYRYGAVTIEDLMSVLSAKKNLKTMDVDFYFEVSRDFVLDFLTIPAQSAGLFPKLGYEERLPKVREICQGLFRKVDPLFMGWKILLCRRI